MQIYVTSFDIFINKKIRSNIIETLQIEMAYRSYHLFSVLN